MYPAKLSWVTNSLRASSVLYFLLSAMCVLFFIFVARYSDAADMASYRLFQTLTFFCAGFALALGVFIEIVIAALKKQKNWARIAAIILCALYIPSLFFPLGIFGMIGLFDAEVETWLKNHNPSH